MTFDAFVALMAPYFKDTASSTLWQRRLTEGMVRCYLVVDRVAGYGLQAVNALYPAASGPQIRGGSDARPAALPPRTFHTCTA